ncbi:hypothetical protein [Flavobacterium sp. 22076]|uniref:hypothetical protein n=1 Tax=unclassified Flavobacterium TaxID=196869 RepID=UPI003F84B0E8
MRKQHHYITALVFSIFVSASGQSISESKKGITEISPQRKGTDNVKIQLTDAPKPIEPTAKIIIVKEKESANNLGKLLPLISTLTGLIIGFLLNRFYERYTNRKKIQKSGKRWNIELKTLEEPIKHQIKSIEEFKLSVAKREWSYDPLELMTTINSERFSSLDKNDFMDYLDYNSKFPWYQRLFTSDAKIDEQYNKAAKISNHIHGFIDVLSHNFQHLNNKWDEFQDGISENTKKLSQDMDTLNIQINILKYLIANDTQNLYTSVEYKRFFDLYFRFISHLNQNPKYNMHKIREDFLDPAMTELGKLSKDNRILQTASAISILYTDLRAINSEKDYVLENMTELISRYHKSLEALANIIEKLDEKSVR